MINNEFSQYVSDTNFNSDTYDKTIYYGSEDDNFLSALENSLDDLISSDSSWDTHAFGGYMPEDDADAIVKIQDYEPHSDVRDDNGAGKSLVVSDDDAGGSLVVCDDDAGESFVVSDDDAGELMRDMTPPIYGYGGIDTQDDIPLHTVPDGYISPILPLVTINKPTMVGADEPTDHHPKNRSNNISKVPYDDEVKDALKKYFDSVHI